MARGIDAGLIRWIKAFLRDRSFRVAVSGCDFEYRNAQSRAPQGSVLGPILFLIYVNDLPELFQEKVLPFADDFKIISQRTHSQTLHNDLMKAYAWFKDWSLLLHKYNCASLAPGSSTPTPYSLFGGWPEVQQFNSVKELGILLEYSLKPSAHCITAVKMPALLYFLSNARSLTTRQQCSSALLQPCPYSLGLCHTGILDLFKQRYLSH